MRHERLGTIKYYACLYGAAICISILGFAAPANASTGNPASRAEASGGVVAITSPLAAFAGGTGGTFAKPAPLGPFDNNVAMNPFPRSAEANLTAWGGVDQQHRVIGVVTQLMMVKDPNSDMQSPTWIGSTKLKLSAKRIGGALRIRVHIPAGITPLGVVGMQSNARRSIQGFGSTVRNPNRSYTSTFVVRAGWHLEYVQVSTNDPLGYQPNLSDAGCCG